MSRFSIIFSYFECSFVIPHSFIVSSKDSSQGVTLEGENLSMSGFVTFEFFIILCGEDLGTINTYKVVHFDSECICNI
uniref:Uncharacterized protein n=1 Tax=Lepeophtheirus salmonis TaxID=72036 RepID=A0A0K2UK54_LEPSM